jgi:serine/threonine protein phosphatase PrpC
MFRGFLGSVSGAAAGLAKQRGPAESIYMNVEFTAISDRGRVREGNEDYLGYVAPVSPEQARSHGWLFALADGVGGHDLGEVASHTAVESMRTGFREAPAGETPTALLGRLVRAANSSVVDAGHSMAVGGNSMATTLVACLLRYDRAVVAHVGDSRCYLVRQGKSKLLTRDHTVANEHARLGLLSEAEIADSPNKHLLTKSLGNELFVSADVNEFQVFADDVLVTCSDGLHGSLGGTEIAAIVGFQQKLETAAKRLVDIANERDGSDNISLQIIRVRSVERVGMYRGRPYRLP